MAPRRKRDFYRYHASLMEPWDGPASIAFTDGTVIGAVLDRNGLRPVPLLGHRRRPRHHGVRGRRARRRPGQGRRRRAASSRAACSSSTPTEGRIIGDDEIKARAGRRRTPTASGSTSNLVDLDDLPRREPHTLQPHRVGRRSASRRSATPPRSSRSSSSRWPAPASRPIGSMGTDTPIAVLSDRPAAALRLLHAALRPGHQPAARRHPRGAGHRLGGTIGPEGNLLDPRPASCRQIDLPRPILDNDELAKLVHIDDDDGMPDFRTVVIPCLYPVAEGGEGLREALDAGPPRGHRRHRRRRQHPRPLRPRRRPPSWRRSRRCCSPRAVHHHLIREKTRTQVGLVVETGEAREVHHMCLLLGLRRRRHQPLPGLRDHRGPHRRGHRRAQRPAPRPSHNYIKAAGKGVLKVMSKMGISTVASYTGAQIFEAIGLGHGARRRVLHRHRQPPRRHRPRRDRRGGRHAPRRRLPDRPDRAGPPRPRGRRRVPVAPRGRVPPLQPRDRLQAPARHPQRALRRLQGVHAAASTTRPRQLATLRGLFGSAPATARRSRSTRSSRSARSSSASPPAPCPTAPSRPRPTRPSPSP